jgi:Ca2+-binding EF-hand superfamily protein
MLKQVEKKRSLCLQDCFKAMDLNCDGKISRCEMAAFGHLNEQVPRI